MEKHACVIVGAGPAGLTAAIYAARMEMRPVIFEGFFSGIAGGQLMTTTDVENFPGFHEGISGPELIKRMRQQAKRFGTVFIADDVEAVDCKAHPFIVKGRRQSVEAMTVIIATGAVAKRLDIPGSRDGEFWQKGVTACAVCDGAMPLFRDNDLFVIGGGDTACEEALFLTKYAKMVYIVHRRDKLRASEAMAKQVIAHPKIEVLWNKVVVEVNGETTVTSVMLEDTVTGDRLAREGSGVFFSIGHAPNTVIVQGQLSLTEDGYIVVTPGTCETDVPGIFAAGDVQDAVYRQAVTAAGSGCMAALEAQRWLENQ